uniref:G-patch domain-containing protein n=1 Tax=Anopheles dirus TaxID=7168 RepID=A0A182NGA4_9DIPT
MCLTCATPKNLEHSTVVEQTETVDVDTSWSIESYRNPYDTRSLWNLKKWFMELHKETIAEEELVTLAQVFANIEAHGCSYEPKLMERVKHLGEPIARVYHNLKRNKCTRTLVPAGKAARLWQDEMPFAKYLDEERQRQIVQISPTLSTQTLGQMFQNIVVVNNSLKETIEWFERLGCGTISVTISPLAYGGAYEVKAYAANIFITKAAGQYEEAYEQCVANLLDILKNYCYQVNYIQSFPYVNYNVERLLSEVVPAQRLQENNRGYRMLQRLGWTGGPLGQNRTGIVNPIEVSYKTDRCGLGCMKKRKSAGKVAEMDVLFYRELMDVILSRKPYYDLIFSTEFTVKERTILARLAQHRRIRCETRLSVTGQAQFVVKRYPLQPHVVLMQALIEKHPLVLKYYEVIPPKLRLLLPN